MTMKSPSDDTHYIDVFFFSGTTVINHQIHYYPEKDAMQMFQRGINKYKDSGKRIMINLRDKDHQLIKSELLS